MNRKNFRKLSLIFLLQAVLIIILFIGPVLPVVAAPAGQATTGGLLVQGAILDLSATPGMVYVHHMSIGTGSSAPAIDVTVEAMGFGQNTDGNFQAIPPGQDKNPYTALSYITTISKKSFHLDPGQSVPVDVTLNLPAILGSDTRYAAIYIKGTPTNSGSVTQVLAVLVPVIITPQGSQPTKSGTITNLKVDPIEAGKPLVITTTVKNTGNHHFKVKGEVKISDASGQIVADLPLPLTGSSIVPPYSQNLTASYSALDKAGGLAPGTYSVEAQIFMEDGTPVDSSQTQFEITKSYRPFSEIDDQHLVINCYKDEEPGTIDDRQKTGVMVSFDGVGKVTGCVAIGLFSQEPTGSPHFTDAPDSGGIGTTAIKYIGIQTQGFSAGTAHVSVQYSPNELNGINPNSLFLAFRSSQAWKKLDNLAVQTGAGLGIGDLPVPLLQDGPVIALGTDASASTTSTTSILNNPLLLGVIAGVIILILVLLFIIWRMAARSRH